MGWSDDFNLESALNLNELSHDWSDLGSKYQLISEIYNETSVKRIPLGHALVST